MLTTTRFLIGRHWREQTRFPATQTRINMQPTPTIGLPIDRQKIRRSSSVALLRSVHFQFRKKSTDWFTFEVVIFLKCFATDIAMCQRAAQSKEDGNKLEKKRFRWNEKSVQSSDIKRPYPSPELIFHESLPPPTPCRALDGGKKKNRTWEARTRAERSSAHFFPLPPQNGCRFFGRRFLQIESMPMECARRRALSTLIDRWRCLMIFFSVAIEWMGNFWANNGAQVFRHSASARVAAIVVSSTRLLSLWHFVFGTLLRPPSSFAYAAAGVSARCGGRNRFPHFSPFRSSLLQPFLGNFRSDCYLEPAYRSHRRPAEWNSHRRSSVLFTCRKMHRRMSFSPERRPSF